MSDELRRLIEEAASSAPSAAMDVSAVLRGGARRRRMRLAAYASATVLTVLVGAVSATELGDRGSSDVLPVESPTPSPSESDRAAGPCADGPIVNLSPSRASIGERVEISGQCMPKSLRRQRVTDVGLNASVLYGRAFAPGDRSEVLCDLIASDGGVVRIDEKGRARGFFVVPARGTCFQERNMRSVPVKEGRYMVTIGCTACHYAPFRVVSETLPTAIAIKGIPPSGFVLQTETEIVFVGVDGAVARRLTGFELASEAEDERVIVKVNGRKVYYELDVPGGRLVRMTADTASEQQASHGRPASLPVPRGARHPGAGAAGWWRFTIPRGDGVELAQWSGECEVQTAFWSDPDAEPVPVTGEATLQSAQASHALGWSEAGEAYVYVENSGCSSAQPAPGVYAYSSPGSGRLIYGIRQAVYSIDVWPDSINRTE